MNNDNVSKIRLKFKRSIMMTQFAIIIFSLESVFMCVHDSRSEQYKFKYEKFSEKPFMQSNL